MKLLKGKKRQLKEKMMNHKDTKKIFANWKNNITNRLDEMFVPGLSEAEKEDKDKKEKDGKVLFGEEESEDLEEEFDAKKADLDGDGELSDYEKKRGEAAFGKKEEGKDDVVAEQESPFDSHDSLMGDMDAAFKSDSSKAAPKAAAPAAPKKAAPKKAAPKAAAPAAPKKAAPKKETDPVKNFLQGGEKPPGEYTTTRITYESFRTKVRGAIEQVLSEKNWYDSLEFLDLLGQLEPEGSRIKAKAGDVQGVQVRPDELSLSGEGAQQAVQDTTGSPLVNLEPADSAEELRRPRFSRDRLRQRSASLQESKDMEAIKTRFKKLLD
jgi:hypothetical protein